MESKHGPLACRTSTTNQSAGFCGPSLISFAPPQTRLRTTTVAILIWTKNTCVWPLISPRTKHDEHDEHVFIGAVRLLPGLIGFHLLFMSDSYYHLGSTWSEFDMA